MADTKITDLTALTSPATDDVLAAVDVSDTTMASSGTTKKLKTSDLLNIGFTADTHANRLLATHVAGRLWKETDTGLIYWDNGTTWTIWKGDGHVYKTADETVNNSATLQDDDHLFFPIEANEVWWFELFLVLSGSSANADFKFGMSVPAGASGQWGANVPQNTSGINGGWVGVATSSSGPNAGATLATTIALGSGAVTHTEYLAGFVANGATAGQVKLQWAQNTATAENSKVLKNSLIRIRRLA